jgi:hypothetical protein
MAAITEPVDGTPGPMTDEELVAHCNQLTTELKRRAASNEHGQSNEAKCRALFDVSNAVQEALIANNCPGV